MWITHHVSTHHLVLSFKEKVFLGYIVAWRRNFSRFFCNIPESRRVIGDRNELFYIGSCDSVLLKSLGLIIYPAQNDLTACDHFIDAYGDMSRLFIWKYSVVMNMRVISFMDMQIHVTVLPYVCRTRMSGHLIYIYVRGKK